MDKSEVSTTSTTISESCPKTPTIPIIGNLLQSFDLMTQQQISYNLLQLNLVSMYNDDILEKLYKKAVHTKFYLQNRYVLEKLINCQPKPVKGHSKQKSVKEIVENYDKVYVNGKQLLHEMKDKQIIKDGLKKQKRAKYISSREEFMACLDILSLDLKKKEKQLGEDDLRAYFQTELGKINGFQAHAIVSPNKLQLVKNNSFSSSDSQSMSSIEAQQISNESSTQSPKKLPSIPIFSLCHKDTIHMVQNLPIQKCSFISTKNRCPLILDFQFSKFLYKNDTQISHELIAMHLIHYINHIISANVSENPYIVQYEIIPQAYGALYQFVEDSMTVNEIKKQYKGGLPEYLTHLEKSAIQNENSDHNETNVQSGEKMSQIRKRFVETYCGFCIVQYLLQLKDRNNSNIMIRKDGSIFHIDLAFIFNATPGGLNFETSPFKFPKQYLQCLGSSFDSDDFKYFQSLLLSSMTKLCLSREQFLSKMNILSSRKQQILCFKKFKFDTYKNKIPKKPQEVRELVERMISESYDNWRTKQYDDYQFNTNKILK